jgi:BirA family biotin operon repressor/biotin-[acetyl-CoA-carboxylase] ligase
MRNEECEDDSKRVFFPFLIYNFSFLICFYLLISNLNWYNIFMRISVVNPFGGPVYYEETVGSTMDVSRVLASQGEPHGTVITADFQERGRGRIRERSWDMERGKNLPFTILLRYSRIEDIPPAITLRAGLAVALAVEDFAPALSGRVRIKWPNDVLIAGKKLAGILAEADGGNVHIGSGVNVAQKVFHAHLQEKATSVSLAAGREIESGGRFTLLEKILARLYEGVGDQGSGIGDRGVGTEAVGGWRERIEERLYKKGERVCFMQGAVDSGEKVTGILSGIGPGGELLIISDGETEARGFVSGELTFQ